MTQLLEQFCKISTTSTLLDITPRIIHCRIYWEKQKCFQNFFLGGGGGSTQGSGGKMGKRFFTDFSPPVDFIDTVRLFLNGTCHVL